MWKKSELLNEVKDDLLWWNTHSLAIRRIKCPRRIRNIRTAQNKTVLYSKQRKWSAKAISCKLLWLALWNGLAAFASLESYVKASRLIWQRIGSDEVQAGIQGKFSCTVGIKCIQPPDVFPLTPIVNKPCNIECCVNKIMFSQGLELELSYV